jgi:hypothetical protein
MQSRIVRPLSSIAYRTTSHLFVGEPKSCLLAIVLAGDRFAGLCAVIVPSRCVQRKTPRCPTGEDARPRGVPIPRHGLSRAVASVSAVGHATRNLFLPRWAIHPIAWSGNPTVACTRGMNNLHDKCSDRPRLARIPYPSCTGLASQTSSTRDSLVRRWCLSPAAYMQ